MKVKKLEGNLISSKGFVLTLGKYSIGFYYGKPVIRIDNNNYIVEDGHCEWCNESLREIDVKKGYCSNCTGYITIKECGVIKMEQKRLIY